MGLVFEWDPVKARANLRKHKVSFDEASTIFSDPLALEIHDPLHSELEDRFVMVGTSLRRRLLVVVFTERIDTIRLISARKATHRERKQYEEG